MRCDIIAIRPSGWRSVLAAGCCAAVLVGCGGGGGDGPPRFRVSGKVTFDGKPVPAGMVYFTPNTEKGNRGPAGSAPIRNGYYDTNSGKGTVGGPHFISVDGFDGNSTVDRPHGNPLFAPYSIEVDLPKADSTRDLEVPASAAEGLEENPEPA